MLGCSNCLMDKMVTDPVHDLWMVHTNKQTFLIMPHVWMWWYIEYITNQNCEVEEKSGKASHKNLYACVRGQECNRHCLLSRGMADMYNRVINTVTGMGWHSYSIQHRRGRYRVMHHQEDYLRAEPQSMGRNLSYTKRWLEQGVIKWKDWRSGSKVGRIIGVRHLLPHGTQHGAPLQDWRVFTETAMRSPHTSTWSQVLQSLGCLLILMGSHVAQNLVVHLGFPGTPRHLLGSQPTDRY